MRTILISEDSVGAGYKVSFLKDAKLMHIWYTYTLKNLTPKIIIDWIDKEIAGHDD